jgi:hypothetical protein
MTETTINHLYKDIFKNIINYIPEYISVLALVNKNFNIACREIQNYVIKNKNENERRYYRIFKNPTPLFKDCIENINLFNFIIESKIFNKKLTKIVIRKKYINDLYLQNKSAPIFNVISLRIFFRGLKNIRLSFIDECRRLTINNNDGNTLFNIINRVQEFDQFVSRLNNINNKEYESIPNYIKQSIYKIYM